MLNINGKKISSVFFGSTEIARGYSGSQLVFQKNVGVPTACYPVDFEWNMDAGGSPNNILLTETGPNTKIWISNANPQEGESVLHLTDEGDYYLLHSYQAPDSTHANNARGYKNGATTPWDDRVVWLTRDSDNWESFTTPSNGHIEQALDMLYVSKWRDPQENDRITIFNDSQGDIIASIVYSSGQFTATVAGTVSTYITVTEDSSGFKFTCINTADTLATYFDQGCNVVFYGTSVDDLACSTAKNSFASITGVTGTVRNKMFSFDTVKRWYVHPVNYPNTIYVYGSDANSNSVAGTYIVEQQNNADRKYHDRPVYYCSELNKRLFYAQGGLGDYAWIFDTSVNDVVGDFAPFGYVYAYEPVSGVAYVTELSAWNNMYGAMSNFTVSETPPPVTPLPAYTTPVYVYGNNADSNNLTGTYNAVIENGEPVAHNNRIVYYCSTTNKYLLYAEGMVDDYAWVFLNTIRDYGIDFYAGGDVFGYTSGTRVTDVSSWNYGMSQLSNFIVSTTAPSQGVITTSNVTITGTVGTAISQIDLINYVTVSNGNTPSFSGSVPNGLSMTSGGSITGTPTSADSNTYQITVSANGCTSATLTITANITAAPTPTPGDTLTSTWSGSVNPTYANMNNATWTENNGVWTTTSAPGWEIYLGGTFYRLVYNNSEMANNGTDSAPTGTYSIEGWGTLTVSYGGGSGGGSSPEFPTTVYVTNTPGTASVGGTYNQTSYYNTVDGIQYPVYSNGSFYYSYSGSRWIFTSGYPVESGPYYEAATATSEMVTTYQDGPMAGGSPYPVVSLTSGGGSTEPVTNPTSLTVSNAGNSGDNGTFVQNGTMNGYPMYQKENGNPVIFYSNGHWYLCDDIEQWNMTIASDYVSATDNLTGTWNVGHYGSSPAPTVTAGNSGGGGSFPTPTGSGYQVTFSDSNYQSYNGTYTDSGTTNNGKPVYTSGSNALWMYKRYAPWIGDDEYYWIIGPASNVTENDNGDPIWEAYYPFAGSISGSSADPTDVSYWSNGAGMQESVTITSIGGSGGGQQSGSITFPSGNTVSINGEEGQTLSSVNLANYVSVSNGNTPSFSASSLPSGLSVSSSGVLSGTPSSSDYNSYSITVSASGCSNVTLTLQMNISSSAGPGPEPEPEPSGELPVYDNTVDPVYEVSNNSNTSGVYYLATKYNTWYSNGESWDTPVENTGSFNGYPVYYNPDKDMYLFYYNHGSGNCWALNHYVMNWNVPASETGLFADYDGTYSTSPSGDYSNGSRVYEYDPCLVAGTKITLADGSKKNVEDITYDDELLVWNFDEGKYDKAKPLWIMKERVTHNWYFNKFSDKTVLKTVGSKGGGHRMFSINQNNFDYPMNSVGYDIVMQNGSTAILESTKSISSEVKYYNIITNKHMNLYANGVLTSCHLNNLYPISNMKFVKKANNAITDLNGIPQEYIDGLRLTEQPGDVGNYVRRLLTLAKER